MKIVTIVALTSAENQARRSRTGNVPEPPQVFSAVFRMHARYINRSAGDAARKGITIVELLVVAGVIGLLASFCLPAVLSSLESARRTRCANNLKQLGVATALHVSFHQALPMTATGYNAVGKKHQSFSPHVTLLPLLEQEAVASRFNPAEQGEQPAYSPPISLLNAALLRQRIEVFRCPSDGMIADGGNSYRANFGIGPSLFGGGVGIGGWAPSNGSGVFRIWHEVRLSEITDGTACTALFAEKLVGDGDPAKYTPWRDTLCYGASNLYTVDATEAACKSALPIQPHASYGGRTWIFGGYRQSWYNHILAPNSATPDCAVPSEPWNGACTARSFHPGGVNVVACDGAVHFVHDGISLPIWRALATRAQQDPATF